MADILPPLDRQKVAAFLLVRKKQVAFREGRWIPEKDIPARFRMELQFVQDMIGELVAGKFDLEVS